MIISQNSNDVYYAYTRGRFWRWDESAHVWRESHLLAQKFGKAKTVEKRLTPETFLTSDEFIPMDDYELPDQMLTALRDAKPCRDAPIEPVEESPTPSAQCSDAATAAESQTAASPAAPEGSSPTTETADAVSGSDAPGNATGKNAALSATSSSSLSNPAAPTFDFGADDQTNALLLQDAQTFIVSTTARIMAAKHAHDLCANNKNGTWGKWCATVGISRDTGDRLVNIAAQCGNIQIEGKSILDVQPLKLLYAAAKPSTPEVVKQAVFTGDITSFKEYQELMTQLKAEKERADAAEKSAQNARKENAYFKELVKSAEAQTSKDAEKREEAESRYESALADISGLKEQNAQLKERADSAEAREEEAWKMQSKAEARAKNAEGQLSGSRQVAEAAKLRADKLQEENAALKKQPIAAVVDEEEVERRANQRAHDIATDLAAEMTADLQARLEQVSSGSEQDARDAYDSIILAGRSITSIVQSVKMQFRKLPDDQRETAADQLIHTLGQIQGEISRCL